MFFLVIIKKSAKFAGFIMNYKGILEKIDSATCIILMLFALAVVVQLVYYLLVYLKAVFGKEKQDNAQAGDIQSVSVIVCARNEEKNLKQNLVAILEQDYPSFEVIVVNDCSEDNTEQLLAELKEKYSHLRSTIIKQTASFLNWKKFATTVGIKAAKYEWLLFTDPDCRPENSQWIASMSRYFVDSKDIVLGYCSYMPQKGYWNRLLRYNTLFNALQYFGFALHGKAYTGDGRNMAYRKSLFYKHNGFALHAHIISGDDNLFVNQAAHKKNVATVRSEKAFIRQLPTKSGKKEWIFQKNRQITSGKYYSSLQSFCLTLEPLSRMVMWVSFAVLMIFSPCWQYVLMVFMLRMIVLLWTTVKAVKKFKEPGILQHVIVFDMLMPFVDFYMFLFNRISSKNIKWH